MSRHLARSGGAVAPSLGPITMTYLSYSDADRLRTACSLSTPRPCAWPIEGATAGSLRNCSHHRGTPSVNACGTLTDPNILMIGPPEARGPPHRAGSPLPASSPAPGRLDSAACRPPASHGEGADETACVRPSMPRTTGGPWPARRVRHNWRYREGPGGGGGGGGGPGGGAGMFGGAISAAGRHRKTSA